VRREGGGGMYTQGATQRKTKGENARHKEKQPPKHRRDLNIVFSSMFFLMLLCRQS